jgi:hypothetical protein
MHLIKPGLRHQDLEGIHLPSFRFSWKLKKLCRVDFFVFESWQTAEDVMVLPCDFYYIYVVKMVHRKKCDILFHYRKIINTTGLICIVPPAKVRRILQKKNQNEN